MPDANNSATPYLVLARKYRPQDFSSLIGQDAMVQTLTNAFKTNRIHHAYILTGVRGVGKTTTARILARAFNYVDESGPRPTLDLSVPGEHCPAIIEGRHVDVMEMDAASNTGIDDIREIIDSVRYGPVSAPYKVYIIDEVHMLSKQAFNGLLKTLEEPPPYVKFIFATTEIRKVPVTILSRCQRFDLRRVTPEVMKEHLEGLLKKENINFDAEALAMIVRAGEGSVRDCQSLTDQAIAFGDGKITAHGVREMLGLADRGLSIDLFEAVMGAEIAKGLKAMRTLYDAGADPQTIIADLADFTHLVTRIKIVADTAKDPAITPDEAKRGTDLAQRLGMRALTRAWQILQAGASEVASAGNAIQAAEMVLIRLGHAADLPTPDEIITRLANTPAAPDAGAPSKPGMPHQTGPTGSTGLKGNRPHAMLNQSGAAPAMQAAPQPSAQKEQVAQEALASPQNFAQLVALAAEKRDLLLKHALETHIKPISFETGRMEIALTAKADRAVVQMLSARLKLWTGRTWMISISSEPQQTMTIRQKREALEHQAFAKAKADPLVKAVLETFPDAELVNITDLKKPTNTQDKSQ